MRKGRNDPRDLPNDLWEVLNARHTINSKNERGRSKYDSLAASNGSLRQVELAKVEALDHSHQ